MEPERPLNRPFVAINLRFDVRLIRSSFVWVLSSLLLLTAVGHLGAQQAVQAAGGDDSSGVETELASHDRDLDPFDDTASRYRLPWNRRRRGNVKVSGNPGEFEGVVPPDQRPLSPSQLRAVGLRPRPAGVLAPSRWPDEPATPAKIDEERFVEAFRQLCPPWAEASQVDLVAELVVQEAAAFDIDPMLLGGLLHQQSMCDPLADNSYGTGLAMLSPSMHGRYFSDKGYQFWQPDHGRYKRHQLALIAWPFDHENLLLPEANVYFAAGLLKVFASQCPHIDHPSGSAPHRHFVSHFVWGDSVRDTSAEEAILQSRRRLLQYYLEKPQARSARFRGLVLGSPLDGIPRVITGVWGDDRDQGHRRHAGIDFSSVSGEPVRAIADGVVGMAGADMRRNHLMNLAPMQASTVPTDRMGPRGLFVRIDHGGSISSLYAHLSSYVVSSGDRVKAGDLLGYVGRTGMHTSDAHLHFGLFYQDEPVDPLPIFSTYGFWPGREAARQVRTNRARHGTADHRSTAGHRGHRGHRAALLPTADQQPSAELAAKTSLNSAAHSLNED